MNCDDFNNILPELADYKPMQVQLRNDGVSHAALCATCARKLVSFRALSSNLLLTAAAESECAPPRVKENLLAAFAAQQQAAPAPTPVVDISTRRKLVWWSGAAAAIAAAIVLAVVLPAWREPAAPVSQIPVTTTPAVESLPPAPVTPVAVDSPPAKESFDAINKRRSLGRRFVRPKVGSGEIDTVAQNVAKEYLPLTYTANSTAIDSGTVIRVQLSRSALVSLGLPMNMESSRESVEAEVVVGDDGVARAIRLVQ